MVIPVYDENPTRRPAYVTGVLLAVNVIIFLISPATMPVIGKASQQELCRQQNFFLEWGAVPKELTTGNEVDFRYAVAPDGMCSKVPDSREDEGPRPSVSAITSIFVHGGWLHLIGNMLFLGVFGNNVEDRLGRVRYLLFFLLIGFVSTYAYSYVAPDSTVPLVGASGAIAGVLGAYLVMFPKARVTGLVSFLLFLPLKLPAWLVLGLWFLLQAIYARGAGLTGGTVAYLVHVVGFSIGAVYVLLRRFREPPPPPEPLPPPQPRPQHPPFRPWG